MVRVTARTDVIGDVGFGMDFRELKKRTDEVLIPFEHQLLNEVPPFDRMNPTAENLARYIFERLKNSIHPARLFGVEVFESDEFGAEYTEE